MIENTTIYSSKLLKEYLLFTTRKLRMIYLVSSLAILICGIVECFLKEYFLGIIFCSLGITFLICCLIIRISYTKKSKQLPNVKNVYKFFPDFMEISTYLLEEKKGEMILEYNKVFSVKEKNNTLYIYLNKLQALLVDFKENIDLQVVKRYITTKT